jgi:hypothetical protein
MDPTLVRTNGLVPRVHRQSQIDSKKHFPSPLAGEGQGEGVLKTSEQSEHLHSKLKTVQTIIQFSNLPSAWLTAVGNQDWF